MAKVAVLVPYPEMCELIRPLFARYAHITPMSVEYLQASEVGNRAHALEEDGCEVIISRGLYARLAKRSVRLPVVEIKVTAQELGILVLELRRLLSLECPRIGLIGFSNMICDTSQFNTLFRIDLFHYMVSTEEELSAAVDRARDDGCLAVIGGDVVCDRAEELGLPHRFITSGQESLANALDIAEGVCYAIDLEKSNRAEVDTMLDYTFTGIIQTDAKGTVLRANRMVLNVLNRAQKDIVGRKILDVLPQLGEKLLHQVLVDGQEAYACLVPVEKREIIVNVAPIHIDDSIRGAILTLQEGSRIREMGSELQRELYQRGFVARFNFDTFGLKGKTGMALIDRARLLARYDAPILLTGEVGSGKNVIAQCIHNEGNTRGNAFISLDCKAYQADTLDTLLFGNHTTRKDTPACMAELARDGTLYLPHIEFLSSELQFKLLSLVRGKFTHNGANLPVATHIRIIASSDGNLIRHVEEGEFRSDLYYALNVFSLDVPPLRQMGEDILTWIFYYLNHFQEKYQRYVTLTQGAQDLLLNYEWPGNLNQLESLCQRIVLLTEKRSVDEVFLRRHLEQMAPRLMEGTGQVVVYRDQRAVQIAELLQKHNGNRQKVAQELGISTTTLWRHMKKYGIGDDFTV